MALKRSNGDITTSNRSLIGADNIFNTEQTNAVKDYYRFQILNEKVLQSLKPLILNYKNANIIELNRLDASNNYLIAQIDNTTYYNNDKITYIKDFNYDINLFETYKQSFKSVLTGFQSAIGQLRNNISLSDTNATLLESYNILNSPNSSILIREYIIKRNADGIPFDANQILDIDLDIKPWYSEYLTLYGPPANGIFDTELISTIVTDLIDKGTITIDEFISDRLN
jgi:hypothetical protein